MKVFSKFQQLKLLMAFKSASSPQIEYIIQLGQKELDKRRRKSK